MKHHIRSETVQLIQDLNVAKVNFSPEHGNYSSEIASSAALPPSLPPSLCLSPVYFSLFSSPTSLNPKP